MRRPYRVLLASTLVLTGCSALIGVNDIFLEPDLTSPGPDALAEVGSDGQGPADTGGDGATCVADLTTDKRHCGRCGHDCLGGNCNAGKCEVVALAGSLPSPVSLAIDATHLYLANFRDDSVVRVPKAGGAVEPLVTAWGSVVGVAVSGTSLFWSSRGSFGDGGGGSFGGVWTCTLPACTNKKNVSPVGGVQHLAVNGGFLYYATGDGVRRMAVDGTGDLALVSGINQAFSLAVDATHVYYTSRENSLQRVLVGGGGNEPVGPLVANSIGFVATDSQRFFWAYTDMADRGQLLGGLKSAPATRVSYGTMNEQSLAVASDDTNVYWTNDGTVTGTGFNTTSNGDAELLTCPVAGCAGDPIRLVDKLQFTGQIVLDGPAIYFLEYATSKANNGRLLKIAKP